MPLRYVNFERGLLGLIGQYWVSHNTILKLIQHSTTKDQLHFIILYK